MITNWTVSTEVQDTGGETIDCDLVTFNTLHEAVRFLWNTRTSAHGVGVVECVCEANDSDHGQARWVTVYNRCWGEYETGDGLFENRALHFPDNMTPSRRRQLCNLLEAY